MRSQSSGRETHVLARDLPVVISLVCLAPLGRLRRWLPRNSLRRLGCFCRGLCRRFGCCFWLHLHATLHGWFRLSFRRGLGCTFSCRRLSRFLRLRRHRSWLFRRRRCRLRFFRCRSRFSFCRRCLRCRLALGLYFQLRCRNRSLLCFHCLCGNRLFPPLLARPPRPSFRSSWLALGERLSSCSGFAAATGSSSSPSRSSSLGSLSSSPSLKITLRNAQAQDRSHPHRRQYRPDRRHRPKLPRPLHRRRTPAP